jgi:hypothetical protein
MRALNLGCGDRFHRDWENVDFASVDPSVKPYDLRKGICFPITILMLFITHIFLNIFRS